MYLEHQIKDPGSRDKITEKFWGTIALKTIVSLRTSLIRLDSGSFSELNSVSLKVRYRILAIFWNGLKCETLNFKSSSTLPTVSTGYYPAAERTKWRCLADEAQEKTIFKLFIFVVIRRSFKKWSRFNFGFQSLESFCYSIRLKRHTIAVCRGNDRTSMIEALQKNFSEDWNGNS